MIQGLHPLLHAGQHLPALNPEVQVAEDLASEQMQQVEGLRVEGKHVLARKETPLVLLQDLEQSGEVECIILIGCLRENIVKVLDDDVGADVFHEEVGWFPYRLEAVSSLLPENCRVV